MHGRKGPSHEIPFPSIIVVLGTTAALAGISGRAIGNWARRCATTSGNDPRAAFARQDVFRADTSRRIESVYLAAMRSLATESRIVRPSGFQSREISLRS